MILVIDNYDSFTYNLVQYLGELLPNYPHLGEVLVKRNDEITITEIKNLNPVGIVISPGPGRPEESGVSLDVIQELGASTPILGVCLGHQSMGLIYGGKVVRAPYLMHGKTSQIYHTNTGVFAGLDNPFTATRYHSLVIDPEHCPEILEITAWTEDKIIMAVRHRDYPYVQGVQFHPESILTTSGKKLLGNFLNSLKPLVKIS
ncbi:glutamine amidotransferase of anthranilate synthase or aminodeoxychorismate synthase [Synechococcus sp. PCC 7502]|uniref:anthranilate synthase component II n=1 Tax=Synechococcus sp. PCC 7502 TaxID=1173263 RepID=UPI00029FE132|nr:aminodeoxychorismate/anthranilate synthase component II [Synechococcus sp. PCC 7502]AFY74165.1 glutamine amidotransferase of anthranilate synthase or aminodeoxychorismate synthase [Synechococcus sp. PCC 7502]